MGNKRKLPGEQGRNGKPFVIYGLVCPVTLEIKYVGQSTEVGTRFYQHTNINAHAKEARQWMASLGGYLRPHRVILETGINRVVRLRVNAIRKEGARGPSPAGFTDVWLSTCLETKWIKRLRKTVLNTRTKQNSPSTWDALTNPVLPWDETK